VSAPPRPEGSLARPRWWGAWLAVGALRTLAVLPLRAHGPAGRALGALLRRLLSRRTVVEDNLARALPELSVEARTRLVAAHYDALGRAALETALAWWGSDRRLAGLARVEGLAHVRGAVAAGRGVILVGGHFTTLELAARLLRPVLDIDVTYRHVDHPVFDLVMQRGRHRSAARLIPKHRLTGMLRSLGDGRVVWFAVDQWHSGPNAALVPFFGVPTGTTTAVSRIAARTGAAVVPFFPARLEDGTYRLSFQPPLADFPGPDPVADAARLNARVEAAVRAHPEQYLWLHRRFKPIDDWTAGGRASPDTMTSSATHEP
jgi:KDO2-lipid IV(A) lauroyltransferase